MALSESPRKATIFDRDGVVNALVDRGEDFAANGFPMRFMAPFTFAEFELLPNVREALAITRERGYLNILATNQPDIALGRIQPDEFERMMAVVKAHGFDAMYVCKHRPKHGCDCRKPKPGMLLQARDEHRLDLSASYFVGDMETDVEAGIAAGVKTVLVTENLNLATRADFKVNSILHFAQLIPR